MDEMGGDDGDKNLYGDVTWWHDGQFVASVIDKPKGIAKMETGVLDFWIGRFPVMRPTISESSVVND